MNRPKRVAYTAAAATAVIAGAAGTLTLGPLSTGGASATPVSGAEAAALTSASSVSTADPGALDAAIDQLTREAAALEAEIAAARTRLEEAGTPAQAATALSGVDSSGARGSGQAPAVHTVTGASGSVGDDGDEGEHESGEHEDEAGDD